MYLSARCRCPSATVFSALEHRPVTMVSNRPQDSKHNTAA